VQQCGVEVSEFQKSEQRNCFTTADVNQSAQIAATQQLNSAEFDPGFSESIFGWRIFFPLKECQ
jgi:hypothetical protein